MALFRWSPISLWLVGGGGEKEGNASTEVSKSTMDEVLQAVVEKYDAHSTSYVASQI